MLEYLLTSLQIGIVFAVLLVALRNAPARWRYRSSLVALAATLFPWFVLPQVSWHAAAQIPQIVPVARSIAEPIVHSMDVVAQESSIPFVVWLLAIGLTAAVWISMQTRSQLAQRRRQSQRLADGFWLVPGESSATVTWFGQHEIWIGAGLEHNARLATVLAHERAHIALGHVVVEFVLSMVRALFWWHPCAWGFVTVARREMELECDEECAASLGRERYRDDLAHLVLELSPAVSGVPMYRRTNFNVTRLRSLSEQRAAGWRHRLVLVVAVVFATYVAVPLQATAGQSQISGEYDTWNVELDNVTMHRALLSIAKVSQDTIYLYPDQDYGMVSGKFVQASAQEVLQQFAAEQGLTFRRVADSVFIAPSSQLHNPDWLDRAVVISSQLGTPPSLSVDGEPTDQAVLLKLDYQEWLPGDKDRSQMGILFDPGVAAGIRWENRHMSFLISDRESRSASLSVILFDVAADGKLQRMHSDDVDLVFDEEATIAWQAEDGRSFSIGFTASEPDWDEIRRRERGRVSQR